MAEWLVHRRHLRGRVLECDALLRRQGRGALSVVTIPVTRISQRQRPRRRFKVNISAVRNAAAIARGEAISGAGLTIVNSGTISGGLSGDGVSRANAISFTGGVNSLTLLPGSIITGNVVAFSNADTLALSGSGNASFDISQAQGFGIF